MHAAAQRFEWNVDRVRMTAREEFRRGADVEDRRPLWNGGGGLVTRVTRLCEIVLYAVHAGNFQAGWISAMWRRLIGIAPF